MRAHREVRSGPAPPKVPLDPGFTGRDVDIQVWGTRGGDRQLGVRAPYHPIGSPQLSEETPVRLGCRGTTGEGEVSAEIRHTIPRRSSTLAPSWVPAWVTVITLSPGTSGQNVYPLARCPLASDPSS